MSFKRKRILVLAIALIALSSIAVNAATPQFTENDKGLVPRPTMTFSGNQASCKVLITAPGQSIDATLELWQGSTLIASWSDCQTGFLTISETTTVISGQTYTLTVSGTIDGISFTPQSTTKTA